LADHFQLPFRQTFNADHSGDNEIAELRCAGFAVDKSVDTLALGIAAVSARLENGIPASSKALPPPPRRRLDAPYACSDRISLDPRGRTVTLPPHREVDSTI
jgi:hypothetical protein